MKSFRKFSQAAWVGVGVLAVGGAGVAARADLPVWMQFTVAGSAVEGALYRAMDLPGLRMLYPRPAAEAKAQMDAVVAAKPDAAMYALRAHVEEDALDFNDAEKDWTASVERSPDVVAKAAAQVALADFYQRRNEGAQEIAALEAAAAEPATVEETFEAANQQTAWGLFGRAVGVARQQGLGNDAELAIDRAWVARYPQEGSVRASLIASLLSMKRWDEAQREIDAYKVAFPQDAVMPLKAEALLAFDEGSADATAKALGMFDKAYQPLWDAALVETYFQLLDATHTRHAMLARTREELLANPDDLTAAAKLFDADRQAGKLQDGLNSLAEYGASKQARHAAWTAEELYTFATLLDRTGQSAAAARYYYALGSTKEALASGQSAEEAALCDVIHALLAAPDAGIDLGSGNLSIYRDLATTDQGPGYWNGILSLWLNSASPAQEFHNEEEKATPYFHREKAAELLRVLDAKYPQAKQRAELHAELIRALIAYGQDAAVKSEGEAFLREFPNADERMEIALDVADVDARNKDTKAEFAIYDLLLGELSSGLKGMALTAGGPAQPATAATVPQDVATQDTVEAKPVPAAATLLQQSLTVGVEEPATLAAAAAYRRVLERYLGRLVDEGQSPAALVLLRHELDRNVNDPMMYERLADFLQQNNMSAQTEAVYKQALSRFKDESFYDKLARFYLNQKRQSDFDALTRSVVTTFAGTPLEQYFANVNSSWPQEYLQLNLYAHARFPHELMFTRNLLGAYEAKQTRDAAARAQLLREHWQDAPDLQSEFFDALSRDGKMAGELAALEALVPDEAKQQANPAASRELAEIDLWQSHFEESAPLLSGLAREYPANAAIGDEAESVFRSLAYFDPSKVTRSVEIEKNLSAAEPANLDRLAAIGDIYADSTATSLNLDVRAQLASAAPYWRQMSAVHPGETDGYLQAATVFWDYFQFDDAMGEIVAARKHFSQPALFGYEAGAIDENKRDYPAAIAEYTAAAVAGGSEAHERLVTLAGRKATADAVDAATAKAVAAAPTLAALELRIDVMNAQHREANAEPLVEAAIAKAATMDALEELASFSQGHSLAKAYREALAREITVSGDPVQKIELQYALARAEQDAGDAAGAERLVAAVYAAHPKLVGVVRHTVDFYWQNKQQAKAVDVLVASAKDANAELAQDFTLEAIAKSNESGAYARARELLQPLRKSDPFNAQYLNLEAQSYSLAKDDEGLRDLYVATLAALKAAPMSRDEKRDQIALARQGLIPALTGLKDYAGAMDQHIALISAFPEDDAVLQGATSYARLYGRETQLVGFLQTTVKASPRDSRFAIDLGRVDVQFEDYAGALAAYSAAIAIRSDRADLYEARADLEEHQQAFDAACADYERLYVLTYKDSQWMQKEALARAREGKPDLAVKALKTAWLDGRTATAADEFRVAEQLAEWNMLPQADGFAAQGVKLAGYDLLAKPEDHDGAVFFARLLARERKASQAMALLARLRQAPGPSASSPAVVVAQVEKNGVASVTDDDWRKQFVAQRKVRVDLTYGEAVQAIAGVVGEMYTPEEKVGYASLLDAQKANAMVDDVAGTWIPAAQAAGLKDREAAWRQEILVHGGDEAKQQLEAFVALENGRMDYKTLATVLDAYAATLKPEERASVIVMAADAWKGSGDRTQEEVELRKLVIGDAQQAYRERLFDLYLKGNAAALLALTSGKDDTADAAANYLLANGTQAMAEKAVANRGHAMPAVWNSATSALVGLYYGETTPKVNGEFEAALGDATIGQQLAAKPDETKQLVGSDWFYYGTRYGFFLTLGSAPAHDAEDYLPAELERGGPDAASFNALAQTYLDAKRNDAAIGEYRHVIELAPEDPTPDVAIAEAEWDAGRKDAALTDWGEALTKLRAMVDVHAVPETFWTEFAAVARDCAKDGVAAKLQPEMNVVLTAYIRKNDDYRTTELLQSAWTAGNKQSVQAAADWVLALVAQMKQEEQLTALGEVRQSGWFPMDRFDLLYPREMVLAQLAVTVAGAKATPAGGENYELQSAQDQLRSIRVNYIEWMLQHGRASDAAKVLAEIPETRWGSAKVQELQMRLAAKQGTLAQLLRGYRDDETKAPPLATMAHAANALRLEKDFANSRLLLEFVFQRKLELQTLAGADYLALAEARIETDDMPGAMDLLRRLTLQGDLYENLDSAAALLEKTGHTAEALPLLKKLVAGQPWDAGDRLRMGRAQLTVKDAGASSELASVAKDAQAAYATRAAAAKSLHAAGGASGLGSDELNLVAAGSASAESAGKPYFVYARVAAASNAALPVRVALLRSALAAAPDAMHDWLRLRIFEAEMARGRYEEASVAIEPVVEANLWLRSPAVVTHDADTADSDTDETADDASVSGTTPDDVDGAASTAGPGTVAASADSGEYALTTMVASDAQKLELVMQLAEMDEHLGLDAVLIRDLQAAKALTTDTAQTPNLDARIADVQRRMDLEQQNEARRPVIHASLQQAVLVRPRLTLAEVQ